MGLAKDRSGSENRKMSRKQIQGQKEERWKAMSGKRAAKACLFICSCTAESVSDFEPNLKPIPERIDRNEAGAVADDEPKRER